MDDKYNDIVKEQEEKEGKVGEFDKVEFNPAVAAAITGVGSATFGAVGAMGGMAYSGTVAGINKYREAQADQDIKSLQASRTRREENADFYSGRSGNEEMNTVDPNSSLARAVKKASMEIYKDNYAHGYDPLSQTSSKSWADLGESSFMEAGMKDNWSLYNLPDDLEQARYDAFKDELWSRTGRIFVRDFKEGFSSMLFSISSALGKEELKDPNIEALNKLSHVLHGGASDETFFNPKGNNNWLESLNEWTAKQVQTLGLTCGMAAEGIAETLLIAGITALTGGTTAGVTVPAWIMSMGAKIARIGKIWRGVQKIGRHLNSATRAIRNAQHVKNINKLIKASNRGKALKTLKKVGTGTFQSLRNAGLNYQFTANETYADLVNAGYSKEEAEELARGVARDAFWHEMAFSTAINCAQLGVLSKMQGKYLRQMRASRTANGVTRGLKPGVDGDLLDAVYGKINNKFLRGGAKFLTNATLEGLEEVSEDFWANSARKKLYEDERYINDLHSRGIDYSDSLQGLGESFVAGMFSSAVLTPTGLAAQKLIGYATGANKRIEEQQKRLEEYKKKINGIFTNSLEREREKLNAKEEVEKLYKDGKLSQTEYDSRMNEINRELSKEHQIQEIMDAHVTAVSMNSMLDSEDKTDHVAEFMEQVLEKKNALSTLLNPNDRSAILDTIQRDFEIANLNNKKNTIGLTDAEQKRFDQLNEERANDKNYAGNVTAYQILRDQLGVINEVTAADGSISIDVNEDALNEKHDIMTQAYDMMDQYNIDIMNYYALNGNYEDALFYAQEKMNVNNGYRAFRNNERHLFQVFDNLFDFSQYEDQFISDTDSNGNPVNPKDNEVKRERFRRMATLKTLLAMNGTGEYNNIIKVLMRQVAHDMGRTISFSALNGKQFNLKHIDTFDKLMENIFNNPSDMLDEEFQSEQSDIIDEYMGYFNIYDTDSTKADIAKAVYREEVKREFAEFFNLTVKAGGLSAAELDQLYDLFEKKDFKALRKFVKNFNYHVTPDQIADKIDEIIDRAGKNLIEIERIQNDLYDLEVDTDARIKSKKEAIKAFKRDKSRCEKFIARHGLDYEVNGQKLTPSILMALVKNLGYTSDELLVKGVVTKDMIEDAWLDYLVDPSTSVVIDIDTSINTLNDSIKNDKDTLKREKAAKKKQIKDLEKQAAFNVDFDQTKESAKEIEDKLDSLVREVADLSAEIGKMEFALANSSYYGTYTKTLQDRLDEIDDLRIYANAAQDTKDRNNAAINDIDNKLQELDDMEDELNRLGAITASDIQNIEDSRKQLNDEKAKLQKQIDDLDNIDLDALDKEEQKIRHEIKIRNEVEEKKRRLEILDKTIAPLTDYLNERATSNDKGTYNEKIDKIREKFDEQFAFENELDNINKNALNELVAFKKYNYGKQVKGLGRAVNDSLDLDMLIELEEDADATLTKFGAYRAATHRHSADLLAQEPSNNKRQARKKINKARYNIAKLTDIIDMMQKRIDQLGDTEEDLDQKRILKRFIGETQNQVQLLEVLLGIELDRLQAMKDGTLAQTDPNTTVTPNVGHVTDPNTDRDDDNNSQTIPQPNPPQAPLQSDPNGEAASNPAVSNNPTLPNNPNNNNNNPNGPNAPNGKPTSTAQVDPADVANQQRGQNVTPQFTTDENGVVIEVTDDGATTTNTTQNTNTQATNANTNTTTNTNANTNANTNNGTKSLADAMAEAANAQETALDVFEYDGENALENMGKDAIEDTESAMRVVNEEHRKRLAEAGIPAILCEENDEHIQRANLLPLQGELVGYYLDGEGNVYYSTIDENGSGRTYKYKITNSVPTSDANAVNEARNVVETTLRDNYIGQDGKPQLEDIITELINGSSPVGRNSALIKKIAKKYGIDERDIDIIALAVKEYYQHGVPAERFIASVNAEVRLTPYTYKMLSIIYNKVYPNVTLSFEEALKQKEEQTAAQNASSRNSSSEVKRDSTAVRDITKEMMAQLHKAHGNVYSQRLQKTSNGVLYQMFHFNKNGLYSNFADGRGNNPDMKRVKSVKIGDSIRIGSPNGSISWRSVLANVMCSSINGVRNINFKTKEGNGGMASIFEYAANSTNVTKEFRGILIEIINEARSENPNIERIEKLFKSLEETPDDINTKNNSVLTLLKAELDYCFIPMYDKNGNCIGALPPRVYYNSEKVEGLDICKNISLLDDNNELTQASIKKHSDTVKAMQRFYDDLFNKMNSNQEFHLVAVESHEDTQYIFNDDPVPVTETYKKTVTYDKKLKSMVFAGNHHPVYLRGYTDENGQIFSAAYLASDNYSFEREFKLMYDDCVNKTKQFLVAVVANYINNLSDIDRTRNGQEIANLKAMLQQVVGCTYQELEDGITYEGRLTKGDFYDLNGLIENFLWAKPERKPGVKHYVPNPNQRAPFVHLDMRKKDIVEFSYSTMMDGVISNNDQFDITSLNGITSLINAITRGLNDNMFDKVKVTPSIYTNEDFRRKYITDNAYFPGVGRMEHKEVQLEDGSIENQWEPGEIKDLMEEEGWIREIFAMDEKGHLITNQHIGLRIEDGALINPEVTTNPDTVQNEIDINDVIQVEEMEAPREETPTERARRKIKQKIEDKKKGIKHEQEDIAIPMDEFELETSLDMDALSDIEDETLISGMNKSQQIALCRNIVGSVLASQKDFLLKGKFDEMTFLKELKKQFLSLSSLPGITSMTNDIKSSNFRESKISTEYLFDASILFINQQGVVFNKDGSINKSSLKKFLKKYPEINHNMDLFLKNVNDYKDNKVDADTLKLIEEECNSYATQIREIQAIFTEENFKKLIVNKYTNGKVILGTMTRMLNDIFKNTINVDNLAELENEIEGETQETKNAKVFEGRESFETPMLAKMSDGLKLFCASIPKAKTTLVTQDGKVVGSRYSYDVSNTHPSLQGITREYQPMSRVINVLRTVGANTQYGWNNFLEALREKERGGGEDAFICMSIRNALNNIDSQMRQEIISLFITQAANFTQAVVTSNHVGLHSEITTNEVYSVRQTMASYIEEKFGKQDKLNTYSKKFIDEINKDIEVFGILNRDAATNDAWAHQAKIILNKIYGRKFDNRTISSNRQKIQNLFNIVHAYLNKTSNTPTANSQVESMLDAANGGITTPSPRSTAMVFVEQGNKGNKTEVPALLTYQNGQKLLDALIEEDLLNNIESYAAQVMMGNVTAQTTMDRTFITKALLDVYDPSTPLYQKINSLIKARGKAAYPMLSRMIGNVPIAQRCKMGLVSLSALRSDKGYSGKSTELSANDMAILETVFGMEVSRTRLDYVTYNTFLGQTKKINNLVGVDGKVFDYTISNKSKISCIDTVKLLPKPISNPSLGFNMGFIDMLDATTNTYFDQQLLNIIDHLKNRTLTRDNCRFYNFIEFNTITIDVKGKKKFLGQLLEELVDNDNVNEVKEIQELLQKNYNHLREHARHITMEYLNKDIKQLLGFDMFKLDSNGEIVIADITDINNIQNGILFKGGFISYAPKVNPVDQSSINTIEYEMDISQYLNNVLYTTERERARAISDNNIKVLDELNKHDAKMIADPNYINQIRQQELMFIALDVVANGFIGRESLMNIMYGGYSKYAPSTIINWETSKDNVEEQLRIVNQDLNGKVNKRAAGFYAGGNTIDLSAMSPELKKIQGEEWGGPDGNEFMYLVVNDVTESSPYLQYYFELHYGKKAYEEYSKATPEKKKELLKTKYNKVEGYTKIDTNDGQEFCSWREWRDLTFSQGTMSETEYKEYTELFEGLSDGSITELNDRQKELIQKATNPFKPVYFGANYNGMDMNPLYVKSSLTPLIPGLVGTELDNMRKAIEAAEKRHKRNIHITFDTAVKVGNCSAMSISDLIKENGAVVDAALVPAHRKYMSIQQETNPHLGAQIENANKMNESSIISGKTQKVNKLESSDLVSVLSEAGITLDIHDSKSVTETGAKVKEIVAVLSSVTNMFNNIAKRNLHEVVSGIVLSNKNISKRYMEILKKDGKKAAEGFLKNNDKYKTVMNKKVKRIEELKKKHLYNKKDEFDVYGKNLTDRLNDFVSDIQREFNITELSNSDLHSLYNSLKSFEAYKGTDIGQKLFDKAKEYGEVLEVDKGGIQMESINTKNLEYTQMEHILTSSGINKIMTPSFSIPKELYKKYKRMLISEYGVDKAEFDDKGLKVSGNAIDKLKFILTNKQKRIALNQLYLDMGLAKSHKDLRFKSDMEARLYFAKALRDPITLQKIQKYLIDELSKNGIDDNTLAQLNLVENDLRVPLAVNLSADKIMLLLNAVVRKKVSKTYLNGTGLYVTSGHNFKKTDQSSLKGGLQGINGIIWVDKNRKKGDRLKPTLNENGVLTAAECAISSQFTYYDAKQGKYAKVDFYAVDEKGYYIYLVDENGKPIKRPANGKLDSEVYLNEKKVSPDLLNIMSMRIPTSGHMSGCAMKIVAFLPPNYEDSIIVPSEHIAQFGEDFDIDKRFCYMNNFFVDIDGSIKYVDESLINDLEKRYGKDGAKLPKKERRKFMNKIRALRKQIDENYVNSLYISVFNSSNEDVQRKISAVLSFKDLTDTKQFLLENTDSIGGKGNAINSMFNQLDLRHKNADSVKLVGTTSNGVVMTSLLQKVNVMMQRMSINDEGKKVYSARKYALDGLEFDGNLSDSNTLHRNGEQDLSRSKNECFASFQNAFLDAVKAALSGDLNLNNQTINFILMMAHMGFDYTSKIQGRKGSSRINLTTLICKQPIVEALTALEANNKSDVVYSRSTIDLMEELLQSFGLTEDQINALSENSDFNDSSLGDLSMFYLNGNELTCKNPNFKDLSAQELFDCLNTKDKSDPNYIMAQMKALSFFTMVRNDSRKLQRYTDLINISSNGIGKYYLSAADKVRILQEMYEDKNFQGCTSLIGEFVKKCPRGKELEYYEVQFPNGDTVYIKPTTAEGLNLLMSLKAEQDIVGNLMGYQNPVLKNIINTIENTMVNNSMYKNDKDTIRKKMETAIRDWIYLLASTEGIKVGQGFYNGSIKEARAALLNNLSMNDVNNTSMAKTINRIKGNSASHLNANAFIRQLSTDTNGRLYFKRIANSQNKTEIVDAFIDLFNSTEEIELNEDGELLLNRDGQPYTKRELALDLMTYAFVSDGMNGLNDMKMLIPIEILEQLGVNESVRNIWNTMLRHPEDDIFNSNEFIKQFTIANADMLTKKFSFFKIKQYKRKGNFVENFDTNDVTIRAASLEELQQVLSDLGIFIDHTKSTSAIGEVAKYAHMTRGKQLIFLELESPANGIISNNSDVKYKATIINKNEKRLYNPETLSERHKIAELDNKVAAIPMTPILETNTNKKNAKADIVNMLNSISGVDANMAKTLGHILNSSNVEISIVRETEQGKTSKVVPQPDGTFVLHLASTFDNNPSKNKILIEEVTHALLIKHLKSKFNGDVPTNLGSLNNAWKYFNDMANDYRANTSEYTGGDLRIKAKLDHIFNYPLTDKNGIPIPNRNEKMFNEFLAACLQRSEVFMNFATAFENKMSNTTNEYKYKNIIFKILTSLYNFVKELFQTNSKIVNEVSYDVISLLDKLHLQSASELNVDFESQSSIANTLRTKFGAIDNKVDSKTVTSFVHNKSGNGTSTAPRADVVRRGNVVDVMLRKLFDIANGEMENGNVKRFNPNNQADVQELRNKLTRALSQIRTSQDVTKALDGAGYEGVIGADREIDLIEAVISTKCKFPASYFFTEQIAMQSKFSIKDKDGRETKVHGSPDLLIINANGGITVVDFKVITTDKFNDKYDEQVNLYADILESNGFSRVNCKVMAFSAITENGKSTLQLKESWVKKDYKREYTVDTYNKNECKLPSIC